MAEGGAHVTSATHFSGAPSIFEVLAQEGLMGAVRPALRHAVKVLAENKPAQFGWLHRFFEESYTILDLVLLNHFLKKYAGSFSENFYGLQRVCSDKKPSSEKLPHSTRYRSLFMLVLFPYIKQRLDKFYEDIESKMATPLSPAEGSVSRGAKVYRVIYPYIHTAFEGTLLCYQLAYALGKTKWHSPLLQLCGVQLENQSPGELQTPTSTLPRSLSVAYIGRQVLNFMAVSISTGLSVGVFFLQFLDWWYTSDTNTGSLTALPVPPPPKKFLGSNYENGVCPLCSRSRTNDTVLSVSGYVFCYPCIYRYVNQNGRCPVTNFVCQTEHLVKLYLPES